MKKIILATLLSVFGISGLFAQNWTKEMQKEFRNAKEVAFEVDLSQASIMGVSSDKFPAYYAGKNPASEEYGKLILEKFKNQMKTEFFEIAAKKARYNAEAPFKVVYVITNISDYAGFNGYIYVIKDGNKSSEIKFYMKDGRWNDFDILLSENVQKLFTSYNFKFSPYKLNLTKY